MTLRERIMALTGRREGITVVCPYCFADLTDAIAWRCRKRLSDTREIPTRAPVVGAPRVPDGFLEPTDTPTTGDGRTDYCRQIYDKSDPVCPRCGNDHPKEPVCRTCRKALPPDWNSNSGARVGVIGQTQSGKTLYVHALVDWWYEELYRFGVSFESQMEDETEARFRKEHHTIRRELRAPSLTGGFDRRVYLWSIRSKAREAGWIESSMDATRRAPVFTFHYHDTAGENLQKLETTASACAYVVGADYLLLLVDGSRLSPVIGNRRPFRSTQDEDDAEFALDDQEAALRNVGRIIRQQTENPHRKIDIPIAVCLNKTDLIVEAFPEFNDIMMHTQPDHDGHFDWPMVRAASEDVAAFMSEELKLGNLVKMVELNFSDYCFFPTSTLGSQTDPPGKGGASIEEWRPARVEDPFLWLLWREGMIEGIED